MGNQNIEALSKAVATGKSDAERLVQEVLTAKVAPEAIVREALIPAMKKVGEGMQEEEYAFPEIQGSVKALQSVLGVLKGTYKEKPSSNPIPRWEGKGELYELGGHLVTFLNKGSGLQGYDSILFMDECIRGLLEQIDIPCHKQAESTKK